MRTRFNWENASIMQLKSMSDDVEKDPYKYLCLENDAPIAQVKRMYRLLAKKYHPDIIGHIQMKDPELCYRRMVEINRAYEAIQRMKGTKAEWKSPNYDMWESEESSQLPKSVKKDVIDLESPYGQLTRTNFRSSKDPMVAPLNKFYSYNAPCIQFGEPDEPFEFGYGYMINLTQLFVYFARRQGISVAPVVVKPFLEFHNLHETIDAKEFADAVTSGFVWQRIEKHCKKI